MTKKDATREKIIEAARDRFLHYGYGKTTMAEVARDCDMSPGNLYRFFPGKLDIAEEIARNAARELAEELEHATCSTRTSAIEALRNYFFLKMRYTYQQIQDEPKVAEVAEILKKERPNFHNEGLARERKILTGILERGNASGEFVLADPQKTAEMLQCATMKYSYPQLWSQLSFDKLEEELTGVLDLILTGLCPQRPFGAAAGTPQAQTRLHS